MLSPSGAYTGSNLPCLFNRFSSSPPAETDQISPRFPALVAKTIRLPSGDQDGDPCPPSGFPTCVICFGEPPPTGTVQRVEGGSALAAVGPKSPSPSDWNAITEPSGD